MIRKTIVVLIIFLLSFSFAQEETMTGGIKYNEASARIEAFKDLPRKIDKNAYKDFLKDPYRKENLDSISKKIYELNSRYLCPFYLKDVLAAYSVVYDDVRDMVFYYNILGSLIRVDIVQDNLTNQRTIGYSRYGNLINISFSADENEQFVYNEKGKLIAHWQGEELVDKNARFFKITRKGNDPNSTEDK